MENLKGNLILKMKINQFQRQHQLLHLHLELQLLLHSLQRQLRYQSSNLQPHHNKAHRTENTPPKIR